ncbi:hypothetical protein ACK1U3_18535 [Pseudomonas promysalinigenes]|uniref:hypothetical protein n=1 Tax=Pseudomonas promysalinigenes TaxID=485898 RepID=UPI0039173CC4
MAELWLDDGYEEIDLMNGHAGLLHALRVDNIEYGALYIPLDAGYFAHQGQVEIQLRRKLPPNCYELKFALMRDFEAGIPEYTVPEQWDDLGQLSFRQAMTLGNGLFQSSWMLRRHVRVQGFVAVALEERQQLGSYYRRLLKRYQGQLGFDVHPVLDGAGYAIF